MNHSQPQTLQIAVFLLYFNAFFTGLNFLTNARDEIWAVFNATSGLVHLLLTLAFVGAGYFTANERKAGYALGIGAASVPLAVRLYAARKYGIPLLDLGILFDIALMALLLHPQSRDHQRIWFR